MVSREDSAFLPAHKVREEVSGEIGPALRFVELGGRGIGLDVTIVGKGTEGVGNFATTDVK